MQFPDILINTMRNIAYLRVVPLCLTSCFEFWSGGVHSRTPSAGVGMGRSMSTAVRTSDLIYSRYSVKCSSLNVKFTVIAKSVVHNCTNSKFAIILQVFAKQIRNRIGQERHACW